MSNKISLSHGNGGKHMRHLIDTIFAKYLSNELLDTELDAVTLPAHAQQIVMTVDGFTVQPLFFPGGDIGSLCVHGTVNDLAVSGAVAKYLTLSVFLEEGFAIDRLEEIVKSLARSAAECGVYVVCGDTKVVPRGQGGEVYITTTGIGYKESAVNYSPKLIKPGDKILISGSVGDHGSAIMLAREQFGLSGELKSDSASILPFCKALYKLDCVRFMRDPTRGGFASVLHELNHITGFGITVHESAIPINQTVRAICDILGYEPYYLANEGRVIAIVRDNCAAQVLSLWKTIPNGEKSAIVGEITTQHREVVLETELGGERLLHELGDDPLPRIC